MIGRDIISNRFLALVCILFVLFLLAACGSGGGEQATIPEPTGDDCGLTSVLDNGVCHVFALQVIEQAATPFTEDGQPVTLEVVLLKPLTGGRYPTVVFHHGSTGDGSNPSLFGLTFTSKSIARFFVEKGWMVAFPQRRGRGMSGGLYDEGFKPDRSSYSCREDLALDGAAHALEDLNVITDWIRNHPDVDTTRMLIGGTSRGGILSVTHIAHRPDAYLGAINFVGGWISEGCGDYRSINRTLFVDGAAFPGSSLWLYGKNDSFYGLSYSRTNFDAFSTAGGLGTMVELTRSAGLNGHFVINDMELWKPAVDEYLAQFE